MSASKGTQRALFSHPVRRRRDPVQQPARSGRQARFGRHLFPPQLWLIAFGLFNAWVLLWVGDILYYYGVTALFLFAFRKLAGKTLLALGLGALSWARHGAASRRPDSLDACMPSTNKRLEGCRGQAHARAEEGDREMEGESARRAAAGGRRARCATAITASYWSALKRIAPDSSRNSSRGTSIAISSTSSG